MRGQIYLNPANQINNQTFIVQVPFYVTYNPPEYESGEVQPLFDPMVGNALVTARFPISRLLGFYLTDTPVIITHDENVIEIFHSIDAYLRSVQVHILQGDTEILEYARNLMRYRTAIVTKLIPKIFKRRPAWKRAYEGEESPLTKILAQFPGLVGRDVKSRGVIDTLKQSPIRFPEDPVPDATPNNPFGGTEDLHRVFGDMEIDYGEQC